MACTWEFLATRVLCPTPLKDAGLEAWRMALEVKGLNGWEMLPAPQGEARMSRAGLILSFCLHEDRLWLFRIDSRLCGAKMLHGIVGLQELIKGWGGSLQGFFRSEEGDRPLEAAAILLGEAIAHEKHSPIQPPPDPIHALRSPKMQRYLEMVTGSQIPPALWRAAEITDRMEGEVVLKYLLTIGSSSILYDLAAAPCWEGELPNRLRRVPFIGGDEHRTLWAQMSNEALPIDRRLSALERILGWPAEFSRESFNLAPWLPAEVPRALLFPYAEPALISTGGEKKRPEDGLDRLFADLIDEASTEDEGFEDDVLCWSVPPGLISPFQRLLSLWRMPWLPEDLRHDVGRSLHAARLSPVVRQTLALPMSSQSP